MTNRIKVLPVGTTKTFSNVTAINNIRMKNKEPHIVLEILNDYCSSSSLHGINYLGAKDKKPAEKIWWAIMFILSLTACAFLISKTNPVKIICKQAVYKILFPPSQLFFDKLTRIWWVIMFILSLTACAFLISKTWTKWKENPVLISFEKKQIPISHIPFPAITVCPLNKIEQSKYNYTEKYRNINNLSGEDYKLFSDLSLVCDLESFLFKSIINFTDESAIESIRKMAAIYSIEGVIWQNNFESSSTHFKQQLTADGLCFTFNTLSQNDMFTDQINKKTNYIHHNLINDGWNIEDGYPPELNMSVYPRRTAKDGRISGLTIFLQTDKNELNYACGLAISGYKVTLHNPAETPKVAEQYFLIPFKRQVSVTVRPELTRTDKNVRFLPPNTRNCYFSNEKSLRFFKVYTQNNCRVECDANFTQRYCGCVPFHLPRDDKTRICGFGKIDCLQKVESAVLDSKVQENCDCLPSCSNLQYTAEISQTEEHSTEQLMAKGFLDDQTPEKIKDFAEQDLRSQVDIFFKESQFFALQRSELYGQTDFLANCGGLLGLFMGFSLLSLLEIIYFLTIRLWFKYQIRRTS